MRLLIIFILLVSLTQSSNAQTFLNAYKKFRLDRTDAIPNSKTKKKIKASIRLHIVELDTIFQSYKSKRHFDFNTADTLFIIYVSTAESPFTSDIIIWSSKDTISCRQGFETNKTGKNKRIVKYEPFVTKIDKPKGFKVVTERDSLLTLVSKREYTTINHLGDNQSINDDSYVSIYVAYKKNGNINLRLVFQSSL